MTILQDAITSFKNSMMKLVNDAECFWDNYENSGVSMVRPVSEDDTLDMFGTLYFLLVLVDMGFPYVNDEEKTRMLALFKRITDVDFYDFGGI